MLSSKLVSLGCNLAVDHVIRFTDADGSVSVALTTEALVPPASSRLKIRIDVSDNGMGIQASKLPLLFKKFSQLDNSTTRLFGGSGLGLAIVRELSRLMDGDVWCESDFGKGSTFHFTFEAGVCPPSPSQQPTPLAAETFQGKHVAVVGLRSETRKVLIKNMSWLGFQVLACGADADFNVLRDIEPDTLELAILPFDAAGSPPPEEMVSILTAQQAHIRFVFISTQRQTAAQISRMAKFTCPVEFLATPLKIGTLSNALIRLFERNNQATYMRVQRTSKRPKALPKLAEVR